MKANSFKGIHNVFPRQDIPQAACADAVNVDITGSGMQYERCAIIVRNGYSQALTAQIDASYSTADRIAYCVSGGNLNRINADLTFHPLAASTATEFCDKQGVLFTNTGQQVVGDVVTDLIVPQPEIAPQVVLTAGNRAPGFYTCAYTYTNADGIEGGLSPITFVELKTQGDVLVTPIDKPGYTATVYVAAEDGSVFFDARGVPITPACIGARGFPENVVSLEVMNAKLFTVEQFENFSVIRFSKPFYYHLFDYEKDYIVIADKVEYIRAVGNTLIICAANSIYGYDDDAGAVRLAEYGAVPGRSVARAPDKPDGSAGLAYIHTVRGVCTAMPFTPITAQYASLPMGTKCATALVHQNGVNKFIGLKDSGGVAFNPAF